MEFLIPLLLIGGGLVCIFYLRPKTQNNVTEIKYMQTKSISELNDIFKTPTELQQKQIDEDAINNGLNPFNVERHLALKDRVLPKDNHSIIPWGLKPYDWILSASDNLNLTTNPDDISDTDAFWAKFANDNFPRIKNYATKNNKLKNSILNEEQSNDSNSYIIKYAWE